MNQVQNTPIHPSVHLEDENDGVHVKSLQENYQTHMKLKKRYENDQKTIIVSIIFLIVAILVLIGFPEVNPRN